MLSAITHKRIGMKPFNPWLILGLLVISVSALGAWYVFFKPGRSIDREQAIPLKSTDIYKAYLHDEKSANAHYLDKALVITGKISEIKTNQQGQQVIILETEDPIFGVVCTMARSVTTSTGKDISIKGFCTGYTTDVVLRDCIIEN
jgi:tRNA_anti-like